MNVGDWVGAVTNVVQALAIIGAGAFGYYKFVRGRTFHRRAELECAATLLAGEAECVRVKAALKNTGGSDIPLRAKIVRVKTFRAGDVDERGNPQWREIANAPVFQDHDWIESAETARDDVLVPLPERAPKALALQVVCVVYEWRKKRWYRRRKGGGVAWTATSIVPLEPEKQRTRGAISMSEREYQRDADEREIREVEQQERQREATEEEIERVEQETEQERLDSSEGDHHRR